MSEKQSIVIPGTNIRLYDGDLVVMTNRPNVKWVVHYGWFIFQNSQVHDWYFSAIHNGENLPVSYVDLTTVSLATSKTQGSTYHDGKVVNYTTVFTQEDAETLNRTFISVDTVAQRDNLDKNKLTNGRLVRVNDCGGSAVYYAWNINSKTWDEVNFGSGGDKEVFYGTTSYWNSQPQLISTRGSVYVYSDHDSDGSGNLIPGIKLGDGTSYLIDMPFIDEKSAEHIMNLAIHITQAEREFWNEKVRCYIDPQNPQHIIFTTR